MRSVIGRIAGTLVVAAAILFGAQGVAHADDHPADIGNILNGNQVSVPVHVTIDVIGDNVSIIGIGASEG